MIAARVSSSPPHARQRLSHNRFRWLPFLSRKKVAPMAIASRVPHYSASIPLRTRCDRVQSSTTAKTALELCERPEMQAMVTAFESRRSLAAWLDGLTMVLPETFDPIPDRVCDTPGLRAAGFSIRNSRSIRVDIAAWNAPAGVGLDACAWQRMFAWLIAGDADLQQVAACAEPTGASDTVSGAYTFRADGVAGHGVLTLAELPCGSWRVIDCWGDTAERAQVEHLSLSLSPR